MAVDIYKIPKIGGTATTLTYYADQPEDIAIDKSYVYWAESNGGPYDYTGVRKVPINGGDVITLSTNGFERTLAINDTHVFFSYVIQQWSDEIPAVYIAKINKQGGNVIVLASHSTIRSYPSKITVDDSFVYWVETAGTIDKVSINGGMITNIAA